MSVSDGYLTYVLEQLSELRGVTSRRMFGGVALYSGGAIFAILDDEQIFFKVDDATRPGYQERGARAWDPMPGREKPSQGYYELPAEILDDREQLTAWARTSARVAIELQSRKKTKGSARKKAQGTAKGKAKLGRSKKAKTRTK